MEMHSVDSSNIEAVGYDAESQTLQVEFKSGATYQYFDVTQELFDGLMIAPSVGKYLNDHIKGTYRYSRV
ncbi:MAG: KTSC domain-containing protein [Amphiplicatus sp.]